METASELLRTPAESGGWPSPGAENSQGLLGWLGGRRDAPEGEPSPGIEPLVLASLLLGCMALSWQSLNFLSDLDWKITCQATLPGSRESSRQVNSCGLENYPSFGSSVSRLPGSLP